MTAAPAMRRAGVVAASVLLAATATAGTVERGEALYARCLGCHAMTYDRTGPRHCGLAGRRAGSVPGFRYSASLRASGLTWNTRTLDRFLADPAGTVPGTTMTYAGIADPAERRALVAYLLAAGNREERCGPAN